MKVLIVVDMQNDFITGPLGTPEAVAIVSKVKEKIEEYENRCEHIIFTRDTHDINYFHTQEGRKLPIAHCILLEEGWDITSELLWYAYDYLYGHVVNKNSFAYQDWDAWYHELGEEVELIGVCTDICVIANALMLKSCFPEIEITVDASCCAGTTPENHKAALQVMKSCQINIINE